MSHSLKLVAVLVFTAVAFFVGYGGTDSIKSINSGTSLAPQNPVSTAPSAAGVPAQPEAIKTLAPIGSLPPQNQNPSPNIASSTSAGAPTPTPVPTFGSAEAPIFQGGTPLTDEESQSYFDKLKDQMRSIREKSQAAQANTQTPPPGLAPSYSDSEDDADVEEADDTSSSDEDSDVSDEDSSDSDEEVSSDDGADLEEDSGDEETSDDETETSSGHQTSN